MAIDLTTEKECEFSAQERYDIISSAILDSYDDGFMNLFVCERALYCYIYATLDNPDIDTRNEVFIEIHSNPLVYWTEHLEEIEKMLNEHLDSINLISSEASTWFNDYTEYAYSMRGMLDNLGDIMTGVTKRAEEELQAMQSRGELKEVLDIAEEWGISRGIEPQTVEVKEEATIIDGTSLFSE